MPHKSESASSLRSQTGQVSKSRPHPLAGAPPTPTQTPGDQNPDFAPVHKVTSHAGSGARITSCPLLPGLRERKAKWKRLLSSCYAVGCLHPHLSGVKWLPWVCRRVFIQQVCKKCEAWLAARFSLQIETGGEGWWQEIVPGRRVY